MFPWLDVNRNLPVRSVAICLLWSMILMNTVLVRCTSGFIVISSIVFGSCGLVDLRFFLVWCMWHLAVAIDGGRCLLISLLVKLIHVVKYPFLIAWIRVFLMGLKSVAWYHCVSSGLIIYGINVFADWCVVVVLGCGVVSCTFHIPYPPLRVPYRTTYPFLFTVVVVSVNVTVQPSSHSLPMKISAPGWRWGKMCDFLALVDSKMIRFSSSVCVVCIRLPYGRITCGTCVVLNLLLKGVSTLI